MLFAFSSEFASSFIPRFVSDTLVTFAPASHYETFVKGVIDVRAVWYFVGAITLLQFVLVALLKKRN